MSEYGMFFDTKSNDRTYDAEAFRTWCRKFFNNGVIRGPEGLGYAVTAAGGRDIMVSPGSAFIHGAIRSMREALVISVPDSVSSTSPAIFDVVLEYNSNRDVRDIVVKVGDESASATDPTRDEFVWQLVLARITCAAGSGSAAITSDNIADCRGDGALCPEMTCSVPEADIGEITEKMRVYLEELQDLLVREYKTRMQPVYASVDRSILELIEELEASLATVGALREKADMFAESMPELEEFAGQQIEASKTVPLNPGASYLGNNINALRIPAKDAKMMRGMQLGFKTTVNGNLSRFSTKVDISGYTDAMLYKTTMTDAEGNRYYVFKNAAAAGPAGKAHYVIKDSRRESFGDLVGELITADPLVNTLYDISVTIKPESPSSGDTYYIVTSVSVNGRVFKAGYIKYYTTGYTTNYDYYRSLDSEIENVSNPSMTDMCINAIY